ncbi:TPA: hypothetical protein UOA81_000870 [Stenotrophomonas maltophilia]|uniref:hypothetical protein n=1 Tax=Stenotrophomonas indicatrix TaxID=2045451 RepID=UPI000B4386F6|nr:hypothetical protein [Stenotrophomonas maltophilia]
MNQFDNDIIAKAPERERLQHHIEQFLAKGGQIQRPEPAPMKSLSMRDYAEATWERRNTP